MKFNTVKKTTLVDEIISVIIRMVDERILSPGDKLTSERELALQLGISRTSLREALKSLAFVKIVEIHPGYGTYLTSDTKLLNEFIAKYNLYVVINSIDYQKAYECRKICEADVAYLAALRATSDDLDLLENSLRIQKELLDKEDTKQYQLEDLRFHKLIARSTHNEILYNQTAICLKHLVKHFLPIANAWETYKDHQAIYDAIKNKEPEKAKGNATIHLQNIGHNLDIITQLNK
ncbi:MAG: FadR family transcriptional regulator [Spirochaetia bacterium]|jgi:GntR family transcriptional repressor for pyruvate dehydrogenase complex|nr:FadR family transcriptional regulator [Spirochaetia bacterium]